MQKSQNRFFSFFGSVGQGFHLIGMRSLQEVELGHAFLNDLTFADERIYTKNDFSIIGHQ